MQKHYQRALGQLLPFLDTFTVVAAWLGAYWIRFQVQPIPVTKGFPPSSYYMSLVPVVLAVWAVTFALMNMYESRRVLNQWQEAKQVARAHGMALLLFVALTYFFEEYRYSRAAMGSFGVLSGAALLLSRFLLRSSFRRLRANGFRVKRLLAVGEGAALEELLKRITSFPELGLSIQGIVTREGSETTSVAELPVVGHFENLPDLLQRYSVDEVVIALPASQSQYVDHVLELLADETANVRFVPDVLRHVTFHCDIEEFDGIPVLQLNDSPLVGWSATAKRTTDFVLALIGLAVLSPLLALIALAVKLSSPGPVLYSQVRMGLDGRSFRMLKFRSMRVDAEDQSGPVWAGATDDRRTLIGTLLRKTSLDELPQLWNVLRGEMSLVGPRPERPVFVQRFRTEIPHYMLRHKVKAGITGWAQVNGWRGDTSLTRRIECDLFYIRNWTYMMDLRILVMTLWKGFVHKNAY